MRRDLLLSRSPDDLREYHVFKHGHETLGLPDALLDLPCRRSASVQYYSEYMVLGSTFLFREGRAKGIGKVCRVIS